MLMIELTPSGLRPDDLFALKYAHDARLSPDGKRIACVISQTDGDEERFEIQLAELGSVSWRGLPYSGKATCPRWSPDGKWLAFVGDGRLRVASVATWDIAEPLTPENLSVQGAPSWSPDSAYLAVSLLARRPVSGLRRITGRHFRAERIGFIDDLTQRIYAVSRAAGTLRCLTGASEGICSQPEWSPCGRRILFLATDDPVPGSSYSPRLLTVGAQDSVSSEVLANGWYITAARWLPDGERIAVSAARDSTLTIPNASLWVVDLRGDAEARMPGMAGKIGGMIHHDMPVWDLTGDNAITVLDSRTAYVTILNRGSLEIWRVALAGEIAVERILTGERSCIALHAHSSVDTLIYAVTNLHSPPDLWRASLRGQQERQLTHLNDQTLMRWPAMRVEHFTFTSTDGLEIEAWFMASAARDGALPTVMFIHGGPFAATGHAFRYDFHLLASHGIGVLFANFRGSAGYGDAFTRAIMGDWGGHGFPDHMGAVDAAVARGLADPERLGVWGASHGGFATCWVVGHTNRFKAAVAEAASTNWTTKYYVTDAPDTVARDLGGRPHEIPEIYRTRSPMTYAHCCTTPTLLLHGEDDLRCPITEAEQFYRVLQDVGCTTELVRIPNCHHLGDSCGPSSARRAQNEALLDWFQRYL